MEDESKYWALVRLSNSGALRFEELAIARTHFQHLPEFPEERNLQTHLFECYQSGEPAAELCLRCWISHCIVQVCRSLFKQFGTTYCFSQTDLLLYVLDDTETLSANYIPMTVQILKSYDPSAATLTTWVTRLVKQNHHLNRFLMGQGLYLISDWAILNDTKPEKLQRILSEIYHWASDQTEAAIAVLESYRAVYLPDRIAQGAKGKCVDPTPEQLQRMADRIHRSMSPHAILTVLKRIAKQLRQYRLERHGAAMQSIDIPGIQRTLERQLISPNPLDEDHAAEDFLQRYRSQFMACLDTALEQVITDRIHKAKTQTKVNQFLKALHLFHCEQLSMTKIAEQTGLPGQDSVTRLLNLKALRADVRLHMLVCLKSYVGAIAKDYTDPAQLHRLDQTLDFALAEQVDALLDTEAKRSRPPKSYLQRTRFSEQLCLYLNRH